MLRASSLCFLVFAGLAAVPPLASAAPPPIFEYRFNDTGVSTLSTGTNTALLNFFNGAGAAADLHAINLGVGGVGDTAFDNRASAVMGAAGPGGRGQHSADDNSIDTLLSFTLQGWFMTEGTTPIGNDAQLINNGWSLRAQSNGNLDLQVQGTAGITDVQSAGAFNITGTYTPTQSWVFFAVTYDGSLTSNNVNFYQGAQASSVVLVSTQSLNQGAAVQEAGPLAVGNFSSSSERPFDGLMDNVRIFGSQSDNSGVLTLAELEVYRVADVNNVPEPSSIFLVAAGGGLMALARRRPAARGR